MTVGDRARASRSARNTRVVGLLARRSCSSRTSRMTNVKWETGGHRMHGGYLAIIIISVEISRVAKPLAGKTEWLHEVRLFRRRSNQFLFFVLRADGRLGNMIKLA
jgi:hypothetical protein